MAETYLLACGVRCTGGVTLISGSRTELENLAGDGKGKSTSGRTVRLKVPKRQSGTDCSVIAMKRGNARGAKGAGHSRRDPFGSTDNGRNLRVLAEGGSLPGVARAG